MRMASGIDGAALAGDFARSGRLHLPGFLDGDDARRVAEALAGPIPWVRSLMVRNKPYDLGPEALAAITPDWARQLAQAVADGGRTGFQYHFDTWRISDAVEEGRALEGAEAVLAEVYGFLNSPGFLDFARVLTGRPEAVYCDAQATRYRAGDFLTVHDDDVAGKDRLAAYVLNLTPEWRMDWGGLLLFHDAGGHVAQGYTPAFNALNIFGVPQRHSVSQVASFVTEGRLAITGWIRAAGP